MKKTVKIFVILIILLAIPALAGLGIMALWNGIVTTICGFAAITFYQAVGLFLLGQLLGSGFIIAMFFVFGSLHAIFHNREHWHDHWHNMSDEERLAFIKRRREGFGFRNHHNNVDDASEK